MKKIEYECETCRENDSYPCTCEFIVNDIGTDEDACAIPIEKCPFSEMTCEWNMKQTGICP